MQWSCGMNNDAHRWVCSRVGVVLVSLTLGVVGCHQAANPWKDPLAHGQPVTTASVDAVRVAAGEPSTHARSHTPIDIRPISGRVSHGPLYFVDPLERDAHDDGLFVWVPEDIGQFLIGPSRFLVNIALFPIHAVATFPWVFLHSDGTSDLAGR